MKKIPGALAVFAAVAGAVLFVARQAPAGEPAEAAVISINAADSTAPKLVVMVLVDQLRADLLDRYGDLFTGGFKRLRDQGYSYTNASHAHATTETAVGHATLSTGVHPFRHGVIANIWYEMSGGAWRQVLNVEDTTEKIVGGQGLAGVSPRHLMRSGFAEWLMAANPKSKVASVSGKDRGAIQTAAHTRGYVYWFSSASGRFVTSTYYRDADPDWVTKFNEG
ncbi:MAG: alkaline phosphatase family protein, partial [Gemmatimonadales bacterium]